VKNFAKHYHRGTDIQVAMGRFAKKHRRREWVMKLKKKKGRSKGRRE
jgi:hypothetical protein